MKKEMKKSFNVSIHLPQPHEIPTQKVYTQTSI